MVRLPNSQGNAVIEAKGQARRFDASGWAARSRPCEALRAEVEPSSPHQEPHPCDAFLASTTRVQARGAGGYGLDWNMRAPDLPVCGCVVVRHTRPNRTLHPECVSEGYVGDLFLATWQHIDTGQQPSSSRSISCTLRTNSSSHRERYMCIFYDGEY